MTPAADRQAQNQLFEQIAREHLFIDTLKTQHSDRLDFHEVGVGCIRAALAAAFAAGQQAADARQRSSTSSSS